MKKILPLFLVWAIGSFAQQTISSHFPGENAWMPATMTNCSPPGGSFTSNWTDIQNSKVKFLRIGGISYDRCMRTSSDILTQFSGPNSIPSIMAMGFTPVVQISYHNSNTTVYTDPSLAANNALAIVNALYPLGVRYFSIGNEPDLTSEYNVNNIFTENQSQPIGIKRYISVISNLIRGTYNTTNGNPVFLVGPELSSYTPATITQLTSGANNILPYIDYFSFHTYPFNDESTPASGYQVIPNRANVINILSGANPVQFANAQPVTPLSSQLASLNGIIAGSTNPACKVAITEANICGMNDVSGTNPPSGGNGFGGNGANGFIAGQFWAEMMGVGMSRNVDFISFWSVKEGTSMNSWITDIGYISGQTGLHKSTYYHFQMVAKNFNGKFYYPSTKTGTNSDNVKVFASKSCNGIALLVMNQNQSPINIGINLGGNNPGTPISVTMGSSFASPINILEPNFGSEETRLYLMDPCGKLRSTTVYNVATGPSGSPVTTSAGGFRFCACYDKFSTAVARCAKPNENGPGHYNDADIYGAATISGLAFVTGTLKVHNGAVLTITDAELDFAKNANIKVKQGGKLIIQSSFLHGCEDKQWDGIQVEGDGIMTGQLSINGSQIQDADIAVTADQAVGISITKTLFHFGQIAIKLKSNKGFNIVGNDFISYNIGIKTINTISDPALIEENYFFDVKYGVKSSNDNHMQLDIACNTFDYSDYAVYTDSTNLKDQGSLLSGAGNVFISSSVQFNNQFRHKGNPMRYYYDPSNPLLLNPGGGLTATTQASGSDATCSAPGGARFMNVQEIQKASLVNSSMEIYSVPNPNSGQATVYFKLGEEKNGEITITDLYGKLIETRKVSSETRSIDLNLGDLSNGIYFISLSNGKAAKMNKIIVNK